MPTPIRLDGVYALKESTYGTDAGVATTNGIRIAERAWPSITIEHAFLNKRDDSASGSLLPLPPAARKGRIATIRIPWEIKGKGSAYAAQTDIECEPLLVGCGWSLTTDTTGGSEKITGTLADTGHGSATIVAEAGNKLFKVLGCRGTLRWQIAPGQGPPETMMVFEMQGIVSDAPTEQALQSITYGASLPPAAVSMSASFGGWTPPRIFSIDFEQNANVVRSDDGNDASGVGSFDIAAFTPQVMVSSYEDAIGTYDAYGIAQAATAGTISLTLGDTQYNRVKLDVTSDAYLLDPEHVNQNEHAGWDLTYDIVDDGPTLTFD